MESSYSSTLPACHAIPYATFKKSPGVEMDARRDRQALLGMMAYGFYLLIGRSASFLGVSGNRWVQREIYKINSRRRARITSLLLPNAVSNFPSSWDARNRMLPTCGRWKSRRGWANSFRDDTRRFLHDVPGDPVSNGRFSFELLNVLLLFFKYKVAI